MQLYHKEQQEYIPVDEKLMVDETNFDNFYIPSVTRGGYIPINEYIPDAKYYCVVFNGKYNQGTLQS